jgi:proteic killer suppression protein
LPDYADQKFQGKGDTEALRGRQVPGEMGGLSKVAERKLDMVHYAEKLSDLKSPPGNRLEGLRGDRAGQHSIRINDQYRVCFRWTADGAADVEITDYH